MPLVLLEWHDSHSPESDTWRDPADVNVQARPIVCRSVGWEASRANGHVTLVADQALGSRDGTLFQVKRQFTIPIRMIVSRKVLRA